MRQSSPSNELETHASPPLPAIASGCWPTASVVRTELVAGSMTETVPSSMFGTQSSFPINVEANGLDPTGTVP